MTTTIIHDHTPTGEIPTTRRHAWIAEDRPTGRHRAGRGGSVHVTAIAGVDLSRRPVRVGAAAKTPTYGLLARLIGGAS